MKYLSELTSGIEISETNIDKEIPVKGLAQHSGKVKAGFIFFVSSPTAEKYIDEAVKNGAIAICAEKMYKEYPCLAVKNVRRAVAIMARAFYNYPDKKISVIGVVGTNGKTTTTKILGNIFSACGYRTAVIGSLGFYISSDRYENERTTPDSPDFFRMLHEAVESRVQYVFCEISAHAIFYEKLYGVICDVCVFTNFSHDHLDFFGTMDNYKSVKKGYFSSRNMKCAIINSDDEVGREIIKSYNVCCVSYGIRHPSDSFAIDIEYANGTDFVANIFDDIMRIHSPLYGEYNVSNLLAALTVGKLFGMTSAELERAALGLEEVEGRFNVINWRAKIIIDYAHTPDGLKRVLTCARNICQGQLICVFGCGGDRDRTKRPIMCKIASDLSDVVVVTSDNPRSEDPETIIGEICEGADREVYRITDRKEAVRFSMTNARQGDVIVLCGKGAENYIEINGKKIPYSDKQTCLDFIGSKLCHA